MRLVIALLATWTFLTETTFLSTGLFWPTALSCLLTIAVLIAAMETTNVAGWRLVWTLFALLAGIGTVNVQLEALFFHILPLGASVRDLVRGLAIAFFIALLAVLAADRMRPNGAKPQAAPIRIADGWEWRVPIAAFCYVILYFAAGILVWPYIKHFYAGRPLPSSNAVVIAMQFLRGLVYVSAMLPFVQSMSGYPWRAGVILGLCLAVFGGIAPLLLPNKYLPADILPFHAMEIGGSNFLFGIVAALLLVRPQGSDIWKSGTV